MPPRAVSCGGFKAEGGVGARGVGGGLGGGWDGLVLGLGEAEGGPLAAVDLLELFSHGLGAGPDPSSTP